MSASATTLSRSGKRYVCIYQSCVDYAAMRFAVAGWYLATHVLGIARYQFILGMYESVHDLLHQLKRSTTRIIELRSIEQINIDTENFVQLYGKGDRVCAISFRCAVLGLNNVSPAERRDAVRETADGTLLSLLLCTKPRPKRSAHSRRRGFPSYEVEHLIATT